MPALCQDINGIWLGKLTQEPGGCYPEYSIELQIRHTQSGLSGFTYDYYDTARYIKFNFSGEFNQLTRKMVISENKVVEFKIPKDCVPCVKTYELTWSVQDNEEVLSGIWKGVEMGTANTCPPGKIFLKRVKQSSFKNPAGLPETETVSGKPTPVSRKTELVHTLLIDSSFITIELYDNGQIDGDTISVFLDRQLILSKKGLTDKALTLSIPLLEGKDYEMMLYAENLGSIPPNTALMVITAGKRKFELYLSSSEQKSALVKFRYEKKK